MFARMAINAKKAATSFRTKLLLHFEGSNGGTTITDATGLSVTNTSVTTSTVQTKVGSSTGFFNGASRLNITNDGRFDIVGDFTIECWVRRAAAGLYGFCGTFQWQAGYNGGWNIGVQETYGLYGMHGGPASTGVNMPTNGSTLIPVNTWVHITCQRSGSTIQYFYNGVPDGTFSSFSGPGCIPFAAGNKDLRVGCWYADGNNVAYMSGYIDELRIVQGVALYNYATGFTPTTTPYTVADAG
jgi:hypothetical protein